MPYSRGECGDFCLTERRLETIDCSLDRWQDGGGVKQNLGNSGRAAYVVF